MKCFSVFMFLTVLSVTATADSAYSANIHYAGLFTAERRSADFQSIKRTDQIPASLGQVFGIYYSVDGSRTGKRIAIREVIRNNSSEESEKTRIVTGAGNILAYEFDEEAELVQGEWQFELWHEGSLLASQSFNVARGIPVPAGQTDGVVVSVCEDQKRTGTLRTQRICTPPPPPLSRLD